MEPFTTLKAIAAPMPLANIDTDKILPARFLRKLRNAEESYEPWLFYDMRYDGQGKDVPDFVLNQPPWRTAGILVAGANFGCGSSREGAVYALLDYGIRAVIAPSFGDIHYANELQNGMLPVILPEAVCAHLAKQAASEKGVSFAIDLPSQTVTDAEGASHRFDIDPIYKERLLKGLDDIGLVLEHLPEIEAYEKKRLAEMPWIA